MTGQQQGELCVGEAWVLLQTEPLSSVANWLHCGALGGGAVHATQFDMVVGAVALL
jgi:hypothetical protein